MRSREFKAETEKKKQESLGGDDVGLLLEDPRGAKCDPKEAYLQLFPGQVGTGQDLGLKKYDDISDVLFVRDDDNEDGKRLPFLRYLSEWWTG